MARYITYPVEVNPLNLLQRAYNFLRARMPGWQPAEGNLDVWLLESNTMELAELLDVASRVPDTIFRYFGRSILGLQPVEASAASTTTTWTAINNLGHTIPAGTQVGIRNSAGELIPFVTVNSVTIPNGLTVTAAGAITVIAVNAGAASTGLGTIGGPVELIDVLNYVLSVTMTGPTSGGADAESDGEYLNRLVTELRLLAKRPILVADFAALALDIPGVYRATALDNYNPVGDTFGNERMVSVAAIDVAGEDVSAPVKTAIDAYLQSLREINFIVNIMSPTYTLLDVTAQVAVLPKFDPATVVANVVTALTTYSSPANWGNPPAELDQSSDPHSWINNLTVRKYDVSNIIKGVEGVDYINGALLLGKNGGAQAEADVALIGRIALTRPGTLNITHT